MVEDTIDLDQLEHHNYVLRPELDADLTSLKEDLERMLAGMDAEHLRVASDLGVEVDKKLHLENHPVYRYSLRITKAVGVFGCVPKGRLTTRKLAFSVSKKDTPIWRRRNPARYSLRLVSEN